MLRKAPRIVTNTKTRRIVVGIATDLLAGRSGVRIPAGQGIFSSRKPLTGSRSHTFSYSIGVGGSFPEVKRPGSEVDCSPPSSNEVKNEWSYTSTAPICVHGMNRQPFLWKLDQMFYRASEGIILLFNQNFLLRSVQTHSVQRIPWAVLSGNMTEEWFRPLKPSSADKNEWGCDFTPPYVFHGVRRENLTSDKCMARLSCYYRNGDRLVK
jgi:hypothetical protein